MTIAQIIAYLKAQVEKIDKVIEQLNTLKEEQETN